ncbi:MAG: hypothetical protein ABI378_12030 [Chitinophagaceae bacterium]
MENTQPNLQGKPTKSATPGPNQSTWKDSLEVTAKIAGILTPVILFIFTQQVNSAQNKHNEDVRKTAEQQQDLNRVATLIKSLASPDSIEREYAIVFAGVLIDQKRFPVEMYTALGLAAKKDTALNDKISVYLDTLRSQSIGDAAATKQVSKARAYVTRIALEYPKGSYTTEAVKTYVDKLSGMGYKVDAPEIIFEPIRQTMLKYYYKAEAAPVTKLIEDLSSVGIQATAVYVNGFETTGTVKPYTYELWLAGNPTP